MVQDQVQNTWAKLKLQSAQKLQSFDTTLKSSKSNQFVNQAQSHQSQDNDKSDQFKIHAIQQRIQVQGVDSVAEAIALALSEPSPDSTIQALQQAQALLHPPCRPSYEKLQGIFEYQLAKPLMQRFDDKVEKIREQAIAVFKLYLLECNDAILSLLPYLIPVLEERLIKTEIYKDPIDKSEEVRLALLLLLKQAIQTAADAVGIYGSEVAEIIHSSLEDPYYEVNIAAMGCACELSDILQARLHSVSKRLVAAIIPLTTHRRNKVRVAAIQTLRKLMPHGAHELILDMTGFVDPNLVAIKAFYEGEVKVNFCAKLITDQCVQVRAEFLEALADWLLRLPERLDHEIRLIPFLVDLISDENETIRKRAAQVMDEVGQQYEKEHKEDLKQTVEHLPSEAWGQGWLPNNLIDKLYAQNIVDSDQKSSGKSETLRLKSLTYPILERPRLGARLVVQHKISGCLHALCRELTAWNGDSHFRAARMLHSSILYLESWSSQYAHQLIAGISHAACQPIKQTHPLALAAGLLGAFVPKSTLLPILLPRLQDYSLSSSYRLSALRVVHWVLRGVELRSDYETEDLLDIVRVFDTEQVWAASIENRELSLEILCQLCIILGNSKQLLENTTEKRRRIMTSQNREFSTELGDLDKSLRRFVRSDLETIVECDDEDREGDEENLESHSCLVYEYLQQVGGVLLCDPDTFSDDAVYIEQLRKLLSRLYGLVDHFTGVE